MIYELRIYTAMPGRLPDVLARFRDHMVDIWNRHGIRQLGYWTTAVGPDSNSRNGSLRTCARMSWPAPRRWRLRAARCYH